MFSRELITLPFKLVIRHNIEQSADDFQAGDVRDFQTLPVRVGTASQCNCRLPASPELDAISFSITTGPEADSFRIKPEGAHTVFLNHDEIENETALHSGDQIRVGHFTFRFQRERASAGQARRADILARLAQLSIVLILAAEVTVVYWLPRKIQSQNRLALQITKQDTVLMLDQLRREARILAQKPDTLSHNISAAILADEELNRMAMFIRRHEKRLSEEQWRQFRKDLALVRQSLAAVEHDTVFPPAAELPVDEAVNALLSSQQQP